MASWDMPETDEEAARVGDWIVRVATVLAIVSVLLILAALAIGVNAAQADQTQPTRTVGKAVIGYGQISYGGKGPEAWRWQKVLEHRARKAAERRVNALRAHNRRLQRELAASGPSWGWLAAADCIYREERGADGWETNTGNGYYGGLQADRSFQRTYGGTYYSRWGTANNWPWWAQLHMGFNGWAARGWQPWPNTSKECGLR